jgi:hypothetical protein
MKRNGCSHGEHLYRSRSVGSNPDGSRDMLAGLALS